MPHKCIICLNDVENDSNSSQNELSPSSATIFYTQGHYGSTFYDPMNGKSIYMVICDLCLVERAEHIYQINEDKSDEVHDFYEVYKDGLNDTVGEWVVNNQKHHHIFENEKFILRDGTQLTFQGYSNGEGLLLKDNELLHLKDKDFFTTRSQVKCQVKIFTTYQNGEKNHCLYFDADSIV